MRLFKKDNTTDYIIPKDLSISAVSMLNSLLVRTNDELSNIDLYSLSNDSRKDIALAFRDFGQIQERYKTLELTPKNDSLFIIDRDGKSNISIFDHEYEIADFAGDKSTNKLVIIDMLKDMDLGISYDINDFQDVAQKFMPKLRGLCEKYNLTILFTHHLNKRNETEIMKLGCVGKNKALEIKREIQDQAGANGYFLPNNLVPMEYVIDYFKINITHLNKVCKE